MFVAAMVGSGLALYSGGLELPGHLLAVVFVVSGWITSVCIHEFAHAVAAYLGGDTSVKEKGYLTLDPLKYTEPLYSVILPVIFLIVGGIGLPGGAVYIKDSALRARWWASIVALAGPLGTLVFGALTIWPFLLRSPSQMTANNQLFWSALAFLAFLQVTSLLFNLIPIPPLDGFRLISPWLPVRIQAQAYAYSTVLLMLVYLLFWYGGPGTELFWDVIYGLADRLHIPIALIHVGRSLLSFFPW
jgi:Zn-dependent protease